MPLYFHCKFSQLFDKFCSERLIFDNFSNPYYVSITYKLRDFDGFAQYLHEKQEIDAYYTRGLLTSLPYMEGISSLYVLIDQGICILPFNPEDSYRDGDNVKECDNYHIAYWYGEDLLRMDYDAFLEIVSSSDNLLSILVRTELSHFLIHYK